MEEIENLTVALIIAVSIQQRDLYTTIEHLTENGKSIAFEEIARSLKLLSHNGREASEVQGNTKVRLNGRVIQITSCPTGWEVVDEWRCDIEVECLKIARHVSPKILQVAASRYARRNHRYSPTQSLWRQS
jgi:hypothetical protein